MNHQTFLSRVISGIVTRDPMTSARERVGEEDELE